MLPDDRLFAWAQELQAEKPPLEAPVVWGVFPVAESHFALVSELDLATGRQKCMVYENSGRCIGFLQNGNWGFLTFSRLPRIVFLGGKAYTVESETGGSSHLVVFALKGLP